MELILSSWLRTALPSLRHSKITHPVPTRWVCFGSKVIISFSVILSYLNFRAAHQLRDSILPLLYSFFVVLQPMVRFASNHPDFMLCLSVLTPKKWSTCFLILFSQRWTFWVSPLFLSPLSVSSLLCFMPENHSFISFRYRSRLI